MSRIDAVHLSVSLTGPQCAAWACHRSDATLVNCEQGAADATVRAAASTHAPDAQCCVLHFTHAAGHSLNMHLWSGLDGPSLKAASWSRINTHRNRGIASWRAEKERIWRNARFVWAHWPKPRFSWWTERTSLLLWRIRSSDRSVRGNWPSLGSSRRGRAGGATAAEHGAPANRRTGFVLFTFHEDQ